IILALGRIAQRTELHDPTTACPRGRMKTAFTFALLFVMLWANSLGCGTTSAAGGAGGAGGAPSTTSTGTPSTTSSGVPCVPVDDNNPCTDDVCENGVPVSKPAAAGTACAMGGSLCDGMGACVECLAPADCAGMDDVCQTRTCTQGKCGKSLAPAGT